MSASAEKVKSYLLCLAAGRMTGDAEVARALNRLATRALRNARGGRTVGEAEVEDLVQELLVKVLHLRTQRGAAALIAEWEQMNAPRFAAYVRSMMKNLAVEANPQWNVQRALREVVKAGLAGGLPEARGMPATLEKTNRFSRELVAAACAEAVARGVAASCSPLPSVLMSEFAPGVRSCPEGAAGLVVTESRSALEALEAGATAAAVVSTFLFEEGADAGRLLAMRRLGFAEMGRRLGLALSTAHGRYERAVRSLSSIARRLGADEDTLTQAITDLSAV